MRLIHLILFIIVYGISLTGMNEYVVPWITLPSELWQLIVIEFLHKNPSQAGTLFFTAQPLKKMIENPDFIKKAINAHNDCSSYQIATAMKIAPARLYIQHNEVLSQEQAYDSYFSHLKQSMWNDINYIGHEGVSKLHYYCMYPGISKPEALPWITALIEEGANPNKIIQHPSPINFVKLSSWDLVLSYFIPNLNPTRIRRERDIARENIVLPMLSILMRSRTWKEQLTQRLEYLAARTLAIYQDSFFAQFVIDHGIVLAKHPSLLHTYLWDSAQDARPEIVRFLLEIGCNATKAGPWDSLPLDYVHKNIPNDTQEKIIALLKEPEKYQPIRALNPTPNVGQP